MDNPATIFMLSMLEPEKNLSYVFVLVFVLGLISVFGLIILVRKKFFAETGLRITINVEDNGQSVKWNVWSNSDNLKGNYNVDIKNGCVIVTKGDIPFGFPSKYSGNARRRTVLEPETKDTQLETQITTLNPSPNRKNRRNI